jgi:hypothetical protein
MGLGSTTTFLLLGCRADFCGDEALLCCFFGEGGGGDGDAPVPCIAPSSSKPALAKSGATL